MILKKCSKCGLEKELNENNFFTRKDRSKDGFRNECKCCTKEMRRRYREKNKKKISEWHSEYRKKNKEKIQRKRKLYYEENKSLILKKVKMYYRENAEEIIKTKKIYLEKNKEKVSASRKRWAKNNKDKIYESILKRRSKKHFVSFGKIVRRELLDRDNWSCQICGVTVHDRSEGNWNDEFKAHIDHIIPISKGGDSTPENLQVLCRTCNLRKSNSADLAVKNNGQIAFEV